MVRKLLLIFIQIGNFAAISSQECCLMKEVGGEDYVLVNDLDLDLVVTQGCKDQCLYMKDGDTSGDRWCFSLGLTPSYTVDMCQLPGNVTISSTTRTYSTTSAPTAEATSTIPPTAEATSTIPPTTEATSTTPPTTEATSTTPPTTEATSTTAPTTEATSTTPPTTEATSTTPPTTEATSTTPPTTEATSTTPPTTEATSTTPPTTTITTTTTTTTATTTTTISSFVLQYQSLVERAVAIVGGYDYTTESLPAGSCQTPELPMDALDNGGSDILGDTLYICGGSVWSWQELLADCVYYNQGDSEWTQLNKPMAYGARDYLTLTAINGVLVAAGGRTDLFTYQPTNHIEVFDGSQWTKMPLWETNFLPRIGHCAVAISDSEIIYIGGSTTTSSFLTSVQKLNIATGVITDLAPLPVARTYHQCTLDKSGQGIIVSGGTNSGGYQGPIGYKVDYYDLGGNSWDTTRFSNTLYARILSKLLYMKGELIVIGGEDGSAGQDYEKYNEATGQWEMAGSLEQWRSNGFAVMPCYS